MRLAAGVLLGACLLAACGPPNPGAADARTVIPWIAATPPAPTATPTPSFPAGTPSCTADQLLAQFDGGQGLGGGQLIASVSFVNTSSRVCMLQGVPDLTLIDPIGGVMNTTPSHYLVSDRNDPVLLAARGTTRQAYLSLVWPAIDMATGGGDCPATAAAVIRIALDKGHGTLTVSTANATIHAITVAPCHGMLAVGAFQRVEPEVEPTPIPYPFTFHLTVPASVRTGSNLHYKVTLTNTGSSAVMLRDVCPIYEEDLFPAAEPNSPPLGKHLYLLNCDPAGLVAAGASVTFAMMLDVSASAPPGHYVLLWAARDPVNANDAQRAPIDIIP